MTNINRNVASLSLLLSGALLAGGADAATVQRTEYFNAPAHCQAALPAYEGLIRKRPLGLQNEGSNGAFVTCAIPTPGQVQHLGVDVSSHDGTVANVTCTAISGNKAEAYYAARGQQTVVDDSLVTMSWNGTLARAGLPNFFIGPYLGMSCSLPPGTGLNSIRVTYLEEIGA